MQGVAGMIAHGIATMAKGKGEAGLRDDDLVFGEADDVRLSRSGRVVAVLSVCFAVFLVWAWFARLDEVSTGMGKVVPTMREQVVQSLEGGILAQLNVRQDDIVHPGQILARLDPTMTESNVDETAAKYRAALASSARLTAEVNGTPLRFPPELDKYPDLKASETRLYHSRRAGLEQSLTWIRESLHQLRSELAISESLIKVGAASSVEVLRLRQKVADLELQRADLQSQYMVQAREDLAKANADIESLSAVVKGRADSLSRLILRSPVRGIVKNIEVSTVGGVIPPNGKLMEIVPLDDRLLVETRISPRDIAFIRPGQRATVKITAYDYAIYGGLDGTVSSISPDTIQDEAKPDVYYYRVFVRTRTNALVNRAGKRFPIGPGMIATVDIHTGSKTVFDYLVKPLNRAREALRER